MTVAYSESPKAQAAAIHAVERKLRPVRDAAPRKPRPKPVNKQVSASVETEPAAVIDAYFQEALRRDPHQLRQQVVLVDGNDGLPIATGVIEGACRYIVRDRMDETGARWSVAGAEAC